MNIDERMQAELEKRKSENIYRELKVIDGLIDFCSNDYLGFASNDELKRKVLSELDRMHKTGSTGSRLLTGNSREIEQLENEVAAFLNAESVLFFNSGYEANAGLISAVVKRNDTILYDELSHASIREGVRLSNATSFSFRHNDINDLEEKFSKSAQEKFIIIESVYSMDGDCCPLQEIVLMAEKYNAKIILDEAHATGVIGEKGEGLAQHFQLHKKIFARVHTCGKAIGNNGAFVAGSVLLKNYLINYCRPFIYTTAPNMMQVIAVREAFRLLQNRTAEIKKLKDNISYFNKSLSSKLKTVLMKSDSAIISLLIPGQDRVKLSATQLQNGGFDVRAILSPTVPAGKERLRICLHSFNSQFEIERLIKMLDQIFGEMNGGEAD